MDQVPTIPPSLRRITTVAERGRRPLPSGQALTAAGAFGSERSVAGSPGCWTLTNIDVPSGVVRRRLEGQHAIHGCDFNMDGQDGQDKDESP